MQLNRHSSSLILILLAIVSVGQQGVPCCWLAELLFFRVKETCIFHVSTDYKQVVNELWTYEEEM